MPGSNPAAGSQPGPLPVIRHITPAADHYERGRQGQAVRWIVLHDTVGVDSRDWLSHSSPAPDQVSIHALVQRDGIRYNIVNYGDTAWQVGEAARGITNHNSLGIELESLNDVGKPIVPYSEAQLNTAAHCVATWLYSYGLDYDTAVVRHGDVALPAGRRYDPWGLDMPSFRARVLAWLLFLRTVPKSEEHLYVI